MALHKLKINLISDNQVKNDGWLCLNVVAHIQKEGCCNQSTMYEVFVMFCKADENQSSLIVVWQRHYTTSGMKCK
jgi:hypothetical protein